MIEIGIREFKSRLSYYVQLMQAGETIAIKVRDRVVGFLTRFQTASLEKKTKKLSRRNEQALMEKWRQEGVIVSGGPYRYIPFKPVRMKPGPTAAEMIRQMRDESE